MKKKSKLKSQNSKLMILFTLGAVLGILIFITATSSAEYKIYLKNGRTISGIEEIKHENGNLKIYKEGILLDMPKTNILKIEEYKPDFVEKEPQEEGTAESGEKPVESQTPDYTDYRESYETEAVEEPAEETAGEEETTEETPMVEKTTETEDTGEKKQSRKTPKISQKHIDSLPDTKPAQDLKEFIKKLPPEAVGP